MADIRQGENNRDEFFKSRLIEVAQLIVRNGKTGEYRLSGESILPDNISDEIWNEYRQNGKSFLPSHYAKLCTRQLGDVINSRGDSILEIYFPSDVATWEVEARVVLLNTKAEPVVLDFLRHRLNWRKIVSSGEPDNVIKRIVNEMKQNANELGATIDELIGTGLEVQKYKGFLS